jgi:hypothetical protein
MRLGKPFAFLNASADLLPAQGAGMIEPLGAVYVAGERGDGFFGEQAGTWLGRNWHESHPFREVAKL